MTTLICIDAPPPDNYFSAMYFGGGAKSLSGKGGRGEERMEQAQAEFWEAEGQ
jgi:hypothetical protein